PPVARTLCPSEDRQAGADADERSQRPCRRQGVGETRGRDQRAARTAPGCHRLRRPSGRCRVSVLPVSSYPLIGTSRVLFTPAIRRTPPLAAAAIGESGCHGAVCASTASFSLWGVIGKLKTRVSRLHTAKAHTFISPGRLTIPSSNGAPS